jgi:hypothetical protein
MRCEVCNGAIPNGEIVEGHTALCAEVVRKRECTLDNCGHIRQLNAIVDILGMPRGGLSVLDYLRVQKRLKDDERAAVLREALDAVPQDICTHASCENTTCPLTRVNVAISALLDKVPRV